MPCPYGKSKDQRSAGNDFAGIEARPDETFRRGGSRRGENWETISRIEGAFFEEQHVGNSQDADAAGGMAKAAESLNFHAYLRPILR